MLPVAPLADGFSYKVITEMAIKVLLRFNAAGRYTEPATALL